ncbi:MAG: hypothetical protein KGM97_10545, partial [Alphaproteobacteria bacterium]|nr:hypothetical protein [Alphaproteobacteria bacterium]
IPPHIEPSWRAVFDAVRTAQKPLRVATRIDFQNKTWLNCEMFVAPLGKDGQVSMLFMTFAAWTDHAGSAG